MLFLSMLFYSRSYSVAKSKLLQHLSRSCKHSRASEYNRAYTYENSQSISRCLVVKLKTSCTIFSRNGHV